MLAGAEGQPASRTLNSPIGNLAGLLAVVVVPAAAGLAGVSFDGPQFAAGYPVALRLGAFVRDREGVIG